MKMRIVSLTAIGLMALGCSSKPKKVTATASSTPRPAASKATKPAKTQVVKGELAEVILHLRRVHFAFDGVTLEKPARDALADASAILVNHPEIQIRVMGHADERGSEEYNIALGERRARVVVDYMEKLGVNGNRLKIISYGEERPLDEGTSTLAYARNRRVDFELTRGRARLVLDEGELDQRNDPARPKRGRTASRAK